MKQGDRVLLRAFGGGGLVRRFVEPGSRVAYVTDEEGFNALSRGEPINRVIGFPWEDVFEYRTDIEDGAMIDWTRERSATRR